MTPSTHRFAHIWRSAAATAMALAATTGSAAANESDCLTAFGQTACGWDCTAAYGQVVCGDWAGAACHAAFGQIVCGPAAVPGWQHTLGLNPPQAECVSAFGSIACGYNCESAYGQNECAQTPAGTCTAAMGDITCFDPVLDPVLVAVPTTPVASFPEAQCLTAYGQTACGYNCTAGFGEVACATWPGGACASAYGHVTCGPEAPKELMTGFAPPAECIQAYGTVACGWGCVATQGSIACAPVPGGRCAVSPQGVVCSR